MAHNTVWEGPNFSDCRGVQGHIGTNFLTFAPPCGRGPANAYERRRARPTSYSDSRPSLEGDGASIAYS